MLLKGYYREQKQIITSYIGSPVFCLESMLIGVVLHRSYLFLCACGNGKLLVECAMNEANSLTDSSSTLAVLKVLQEYTRRNGFRSVKFIQF